MTIFDYCAIIKYKFSSLHNKISHITQFFTIKGEHEMKIYPVIIVFLLFSINSAAASFQKIDPHSLNGIKNVKTEKLLDFVEKRIPEIGKVREVRFCGRDGVMLKIEQTNNKSLLYCFSLSNPIDIEQQSENKKPYYMEKIEILEETIYDSYEKGFVWDPTYTRPGANEREIAENAERNYRLAQLHEEKFEIYCQANNQVGGWASASDAFYLAQNASEILGIDLFDIISQETIQAHLATRLYAIQASARSLLANVDDPGDYCYLDKHYDEAADLIQWGTPRQQVKYQEYLDWYCECNNDPIQYVLDED